MSAAARAEARRKAILSRGTDRLAKLTTSARGEDNPVYKHDDPPLPKLGNVSLENFVGEESALPPPSISNTAQEVPPEQIAFLNNLQERMNAFTQTNSDPRGNFDKPSIGSNPESLPDDPLAAMFSQLTQQGFDPSAFQQGPSSGVAPSVAQKSTTQKALPLLYLLATWLMLSYSVAIWEPQVYESVIHDLSHDSLWSRWSELGWREAKGKIGVQALPIFWAFTTLQLLVHSTVLLTKNNTFQPPALLSMILPGLPPRISLWVTRCLSYWQLVGIFLDNLAALIFGVGVMIWISTYVT